MYAFTKNCIEQAVNALLRSEDYAVSDENNVVADIVFCRDFNRDSDNILEKILDTG